MFNWIEITGQYKSMHCLSLGEFVQMQLTPLMSKSPSSGILSAYLSLYFDKNPEYKEFTFLCKLSLTEVDSENF